MLSWRPFIHRLGSHLPFLLSTAQVSRIPCKFPDLWAMQLAPPFKGHPSNILFLLQVALEHSRHHLKKVVLLDTCCAHTCTKTRGRPEFRFDRLAVVCSRGATAFPGHVKLRPCHGDLNRWCRAAFKPTTHGLGMEKKNSRQLSGPDQIGSR